MEKKEEEGAAGTIPTPLYSALRLFLYHLPLGMIR